MWAPHVRSCQCIVNMPRQRTEHIRTCLDLNDTQAKLMYPKKKLFESIGTYR